MRSRTQKRRAPNGKATEDNTTVELFTTPTPPKFRLETRAIYQARIRIPPNSDHVLHFVARTFPKEGTLVGLHPHMHLRGRDFKFDAMYPDGTQETLLSVPAFNMGFQHYYYLATPKRMPAGTTIVCSGHFDNTLQNPLNPDPGALVRMGDQTFDEMFIGFITIAFDSQSKDQINGK